MKHFLGCIFLLLATLVRAGAAGEAEEGVKAATKVREIFEAKCLDCHGPELPRPKGKFGYVLDLKRMAENPEYVEKGVPEKSELYLLVKDDEMPGEDSNVPPLTNDEKEFVRRWIELGAPDAPAASATTEHSTTAATPAADAKPPRPFWKKALEWIGRFHPASTHFPVALMLVAVFAEGLAWWTRRESWLQTVRFLVVLGALGGVGTGILGWINAYFSSYSKDPWALLWVHRWLGTAATLWALLCAILIMSGKCEEGSKQRWYFRGALLVGAALIAVSGFLGSALIYGLQHYSWK